MNTLPLGRDLLKNLKHHIKISDSQKTIQDNILPQNNSCD